MDTDTLFYAVGGLLVLIALIVSAIGMRSDNFPSNGVLRIGVLMIAVVVVVTGYTAVEASEEEALAREEEENILAAEEADEMAGENEEAGVSGSDTDVDTPPGEPADGGGDATTASVEQGSAVFVDNGCGSCHTLADQGDNALGQIGPNLDAELVNQDAAYIETSIVDPSAVVVEGFGDNIMPSDYGETIPPEDLDALVAYLDEVTSESSPAG